MRYFIDTEFIEGFHKPLFGKRRHYIDLISIGIVAEDGRTYEAISSEYRWKDADVWVQDNVLMPLYRQTLSGDERNRFHLGTFHKTFGKSNAKIAQEIIKFVNDDPKGPTILTRPEFYAYYADYDWVVFCSLFGRMLDLPAGFPMYCKDLKQMLDEKAESYSQINLTTHLFSGTAEQGWEISEGAQISKDIINIDDYTLGMRLELIKSQSNYPKQENEHSALDDAKWNQKLYKFLHDI